MDYEIAILLGMLLLAATLYSAAGQGGGSGYLAVMALFGLTPMVMKPAALAMNVAVTLLTLGITSGIRHIPVKLFMAVTVPSFPTALLGGYFLPPATVYGYLVAGALVVAALSLWRERRELPVVTPPRPITLAPIGGLIGLISGLTGVGGGIFLAPILLIKRWADLRATLAMSSAFILINSIAALIGHAFSNYEWPSEVPMMIAAALLGALLGSVWGRRYLGTAGVRWLLGGVLLVAAARMLFFAHQ